MTSNPMEEKWQVRLLRPGIPGMDRLPDLVGLPDLKRLPFLNRPMLPAEAGDGLRDAMLARENHVEDVNYTKVVPNRYVVEVSQANYDRHYRPIESQVLKQWTDRLLRELITANSRRGRKEFRLGGRLRIEIRPAQALRDNEARILSRIEPDIVASQSQVEVPASARPRVPAPYTPPPASRPNPHEFRQGAGPQRPIAPPNTNQVPPGTGPRQAAPQGNIRAAFIELVPSGRRWSLYSGVNTIGRSDASQIFLDLPLIQEKRLVSGQHAYIVFENGTCTLFDGAPDGRPSANGTYVNLRRVPPGGYRLQNGDAIVLAAVDPLYPRSDTPGAATFYFWANRRD